MKKIFRFICTLSLVFLLSACGGGGGDDDGGGIADTEKPIVTPGTSATGTVSSATVGIAEITAASGAMITVPPGAVPKTASGEEGAVAFSIEKDSTTTLQVPTGVTQLGDAYRFGPSGTVFEKPVAVTLPLTTTYDPSREYFLYRVNPTTGVSEPYRAVYDPVAKTLTAQTYEFSPWYPGDRPAVNTANGCVNVDNSTSSIWRSVVTQSWVLKYPQTDTNFNGATATWSNGAIGWSNHSDWYLPQGTYQMCVEGTVNGAQAHSADIPVAINSPWNYSNPVCTQLGISGVALSLPGDCSVSPPATKPVGTGALQISLTWHSADAIDVDLHVTEPGGEEVYYGNLNSAAGGKLDQDNKCGNYVNGQSENIFWTNPPAGQYTIKVVFFSACSNNKTNMPYELRVVNNGITTTYSGNAISSGDVKTITVADGSGGGGCPSGPFTDKVTIGSGFSGSNITGGGTSFSLANMTNHGDLYARIESSTPFKSTSGNRFARLYVNDGTYSTKDFCSTCNNPPVLDCPNLMIGKFRITDIGNWSIKVYSSPMTGYTESYIGGSSISVGQ